MTTIPENYRTDHLFLLIGENPLPNYVSAQLLRPRATLTLLHTGLPENRKQMPGQTESALLALKLQRLLEKKLPGVDVRKESVPPAGSRLIEEVVQPLLEDLDGTVGLNYTGGTKAMALHTYRVLADRYGSNAVFSYLDATGLALHVDGRRQPFPVADDVQVALAEMAALHGYQVHNPGRQETRLLPLARSLVEVHQNPDWQAVWHPWLKDKPLTQLPDLPPLQSALAQMGNPAPAELAAALGLSELNQLSHWFSGVWFEELALEAMLQNKDYWPMMEVTSGLVLKPDPEAVRIRKERDTFELDVTATIGYQLFLISCIATDRKAAAKEHFLEAFVRARQLGGEEARVALLCLVSDPERLQREIERQWHGAGRVRVFGSSHLPQLSRYVHDWLQQSRRNL